MVKVWGAVRNGEYDTECWCCWFIFVGPFFSWWRYVRHCIFHTCLPHAKQQRDPRLSDRPLFESVPGLPSFDLVLAPLWRYDPTSVWFNLPVSNTSFTLPAPFSSPPQIIPLAISRHGTSMYCQPFPVPLSLSVWLLCNGASQYARHNWNRPFWTNHTSPEWFSWQEL